MQLQHQPLMRRLPTGLPQLPMRVACVLHPMRPTLHQAASAKKQGMSAKEPSRSSAPPRDDGDTMPPDPEYSSLTSMDDPAMLPTSSHPALPDHSSAHASTTSSSSNNNTSSSSEPGSSQAPQGPHNPLQRLLSFLKPPEWLVLWWGLLFDPKVQRKANPRILQFVRLGTITALVMAVTTCREALTARSKPVTHEVLYSSFVHLLDTGRVRAARLESGTSRLYFDLRPRDTAATTTAATTTAEATPTTSPATTPTATAAASATAAAASAQPAAAPASSQLVPAMRFQRQFVVKLAEKTDPALVSRVLMAGVEFGVLRQSFTSVLANTFMTALALWIPLTPLLFILRRIIEERSGTRKKKGGDGVAASVTTTFRDVAGVDSAKEELMEVVSVMRAQKSAYSRLKVKMPSGVLLSGPPGTGKTLLAKAVAGEAGVPFMAVSASEFVELYVGRGAARIRELFAEARKAAPCVVFIDELDAVASRRGMGYNDERDQTLNQLLTELDGFEGREGVLLLAATNRLDVLDPAVTRPGRISRKVVVPLPDEGGRRDILGVHLRGVPLAPDLGRAEACERLARVTSGFSGAELANVVNEAALLAARQDAEAVGMAELLEGVRRTKFGVNGGGGSGARPAGGAFTKWLMDIAAGPSERKVKNAAV